MSPAPLLCALLSAVVPGAGQIAAGARRRGALMLAVVAAMLVLAFVVVGQGVDWILAAAVRPRVLPAVVVLDLALVAFRVFAVVDAYRLAATRPHRVGSPSAASADSRSTARADSPSTPRVMVVGGSLVLLLAATVAPHAVVGYYAYLSHDLLTTVFVEEGEASPETTGPSPTTSPALPTVTATATATPVTGAARTTTSPTAPTTTTVDPAAVLGAGDDRRLTVLLVGTDAGYGRSGARADVVMVATIDLVDGYVALFGIPRNTGDLPLEGAAAQALGTKTYADMISNLYEEAATHPELAPEGGDPGALVVARAAETLLGIPIDHYAVVGMGGFVALVDAFGGITLDVKERVRVRMSPPVKGEKWRVYDIPPGRQELDGHEALAFARSRSGTSDYDRMRRQRCVLKALLYQNGAAELALRFPKVVTAIKDHVRTDVTLDVLGELIEVRSRLKTDRMLTVGLTPDHYLAGRNALGYNILDRDEVQATVRQIVDDPEQALLAQGPSDSVDASDCWKVD